MVDENSICQDRQFRVLRRCGWARGRSWRNPSRLDLSECLSDAVAMDLDAPVLFKHADFEHIGIKRAP